MNKRTDLALETLENQKEKQLSGVRSLVREVGGVRVTAVSVWNDAGAEALEKPKGNYITLELPDRFENLQAREQAQTLLTEELQKMLPEKGLILVVGLGNEAITPDALGPKCAKRLFATRHIGKELSKSAGLGDLRAVAAIAPGVLGQTGIETAEIIEALVQQIQPQTVVVVDALASCKMARLGTTIQLTDTGIAPGSGVGNRRAALNSETLGVPVIAVGVPTVVDATTMALDLLQENGVEAPKLTNEHSCLMMVTPKEIDLMMERAAALLSMSINCALQPHLTVQDLQTITA